MKLLLKTFHKREFLFVLICLVLIVLQVFLELRMPEYMNKITVLVNTEGNHIKEIIYQGSFMLLCALGSLATLSVISYFSSKLSSSISFNLRKKIFDKVQSFSKSEIKKFSTSSLITRTTNDVNQVEMLIMMGLQVLVKAPIMAVWALIKILNKGYEWSILTGGLLIILMVIIAIIMSLVIPRFKIVQKLIDKINMVTRENITGIRVIRAFNAEDFQNKRFSKVNNDLTRNQIFTQHVFAILNPSMNIIMHTLTLGIALIGAVLINKAGLYDKVNIFGNMVVFSNYGMQVIMSFLMLAAIFMILPRASVSINRINEVLESESSIKNGSLKNKTDYKGEIIFKNVSFKYPDASEYLLKNISFTVKQGETVAFIGSTGSGKSTLINLIPRFYDVTEGEILIDGVNIMDYDLNTLHKKIGYVSQKAVLFTGSIKDNLLYGDNRYVYDKKLNEILKVAQADKFVKKMPHGLNAHIARGGTNISGGQKQRLSIARAIARNPEIYIFDDSFSALDYKTDANLRKELKKYTKNATCLIVAQRIGTIINADKIVVLDNGECVGVGTHRELMKNCQVYQEIALSQLNVDELEKGGVSNA